MKNFIQNFAKKNLRSIALGGLMSLSAFSVFAQDSKELGSVNSLKQLLTNNVVKTTNRVSTTGFDLEGPDQKFKAKINANYTKAGAETFAGKILNHGWADFHVQFKNGKASGLIILFDEKKAYEFKTNSIGNVVVEERSFDKTVSVDHFGTSLNTVSPSQTGTPGTTGDGTVIPLLQSNPSASTVVYLDFDGEYVANTPWNGGVPIDAAKPNGTDQNIRTIWGMMAEDFAPFNLNVTTDINVYNATPAGRRQMVIFTPDNTAAPGAGGVAYVGGFAWMADLPCWVFISPYDAANAAEAGSHEVGHTFGLGHDGRNFPDGSHEEYYGGHAKWGPIVGVAYGKEVSQFSKGEYQYASNTEDDLSIITSLNNGFGYKTDDYGSSSTTAFTLNLNNNSILQNGTISTREDKDYFKFTLNSSALVSIDVNKKYNVYTNLNVLAQILDVNQQVVFESNPTDRLTANFSNINLNAGTYYIVIDGVGEGLDASTGYSDYGSLGEYVLSGTITPVIISCTDPAWDVNLAYYGGQKVSFNNVIYTANWWTQGNQPDINSGPSGSGKPWTQTGTCSNNKAPVVTFTAPAKNSVFNMNTNVKLVASAVDPDGTISKVEFLDELNNTISTITSAPYEYTLQNVAVGSYIYKVRAFDNNNAFSDLATNNFTVVDPSPSIVINTPTEGQVLNLSTGQKVNVAVTTTPSIIDSVRYVVVDVTCNGPGCAQVRRFVTATAPYSISYDPIAGAVSSQVNAIAFRNGYGSQATVNYTTNVVTTTKPVVTITSPSAGSVSYQYPSDANQTTITLGFNVATSAIDSVKYTLVETICNGPGCVNQRKETVKTAPFSYAYLPSLKYNGYTEVQVVAFSKGLASDPVTQNFYVKPLPELSFVSPINNSSVSRSTTSIPVDVTVNTANLAIDSVVYTIYDTKTTGMSGITTTRKFVVASPYDFNLPVLADQTFTRIYALAFGDGGKFSRSKDIQINYNDAPVITVTAPLANNGINPKYLVGGSQTVSANVTDDVAVVKVEFALPKTGQILTVTSAPFTATFTNLPASYPDGSLYYTITAYDNQGATSTKTVVVYKNRVPSIALASATASGNVVTINAAVNDGDWTSGKVEFFNGNTKLGEKVFSGAYSVPYVTYTWTGVANGSYAVSAKVTDDMGEFSTSTAINVTVGTTCTAQLWNASTAYTGGQVVQYNGIKYIANWWTLGNQPDLNNGPSGSGKPWTSQGACNARLGAEEANVVFNATAYPNPFTNTLTIEAPVSSNSAVVTLLDLNGSVLAENVVNSNNNSISTTFETSNLVSGVYVVRINDGISVVALKVVK